jgi:hypothetical protein
MKQFIVTCASVFIASTGIALAQPPTTPEQIKDCARSMTDAMRNCGSQVPSVKATNGKSDETAQGREEKLSCLRDALNSYFYCISGGLGATNPGSKTTATPAATTTKKTTTTKAAPAVVK